MNFKTYFKIKKLKKELKKYLFLHSAEIFSVSKNHIFYSAININRYKNLIEGLKSQIKELNGNKEIVF